MGSVGVDVRTSLTTIYPYDSKLMKVSKKQYDMLISEWTDSRLENTSEEDIAYDNEFFLNLLYKKKYSPLV